MTASLDDPDHLNAQYNNRARVPGHAEIFARWQSDSTAARARLASRLDLPYGETPGERLDVFLPRAAGAPVLVFVHGGYWRSLSKHDHSFVAPAFVDAGAMVVVPDYDLCPAVTIETIALQTARALAWTWRHAVSFGGEPSQIVVVGHSAGAHLAAMLLCCDWPALKPELPRTLLKSAIGISGLYDLEPIRRTPFLQADLRLTEASVPRISPAGFPPPRGPLLAVVGADESDEFLRHNRLIRERWGAQAVPVCETLPGRHHFDVLDDLIDPRARLHHQALGLLGLGNMPP
jgi:arylformamidase